jgi:hypothetical protein
MGLLDKAHLEPPRGPADPAGSDGLLARALAARPGRSAPRQPALPEDEPLFILPDEAFDAEPSPRRAPQPWKSPTETLPSAEEPVEAELEPLSDEPELSNPEFGLSSEDIDAIRGEILGIRPGIDYILAVYARLAEALPVSGLALFLPRAEELCLAAAFGFIAKGADGELSPTLPLSLIDALPPGLSPPRGALLDALVAVLGGSAASGLLCARISAAESRCGLWALSAPNVSSAPSELLSSLGALLAAPSPAPSRFVTIPEPVASLASGLLASVKANPRACAFVLDLSAQYEVAETRVPGLMPQVFLSAAALAANSILGHGGSSILRGSRSLACVFGSSSAIDPELALFQFSKSLRRSLMILEGSSPPSGRSFGFDPRDPGAETALSLFFAA